MVSARDVIVVLADCVFVLLGRGVVQEGSDPSLSRKQCMIYRSTKRFGLSITHAKGAC